MCWSSDRNVPRVMRRQEKNEAKKLAKSSKCMAGQAEVQILVGDVSNSQATVNVPGNAWHPDCGKSSGIISPSTICDAPNRTGQQLMWSQSISDLALIVLPDHLLNRVDRCCL